MFICGKPSEKYHFNRLARTNPPHHPLDPHAIELRILPLSGLKLDKELFIFDVPIKFRGEDHFIHTFKCGETNKETLVLIHGYGGSSLFYFSMLKDLSQKYRVFCIDLLGMGLSSRGDFPCKDAEETIDYFVESIESWREAMNLKEFQLAGHSLGGYISAQYALRHQDKVKKLFLLSPAGLTKYENEVTAADVTSSMGYIKRKRFEFVQRYWTNRVTPAEFYRRSPVFGKFVLRKYVYKQFGAALGYKKKYITLLFEYCNALLMEPKGSEMAIFMLLKPPVTGAEIPLEEDIAKKLHIPVVCYYGDTDWMNSEGARRLHGSGDFKFKLVDNAGHQMIVQNPKMLTEDILMEGLARQGPQSTCLVNRRSFSLFRPMYVMA